MYKLRKISKVYYFRQIISVFLAAYLFLGPVAISMASTNPGADALPSGIIDSTGIGSFDYGAPGQLVITQTAEQAITNWNNFDIGANAGVTFIQPGSAAAALNRVHDGNPTGIMGSLTANGRIFVVNPAGVVFGAGAAVNVAQLVASSLNITDRDFIDGKFDFSGVATGDVINYGSIEAAQGVALIGRKILNAGSITTKEGGFVVMTAGDRVLLGQPGSKIVVEMSSVSSDLQGSGDVINEGQIDADGGTIVLAAGDLFSMAAELESAPAKIKTGTGSVVQSGNISAGSGDITLTAADEVSLTDGSLTSANGGINGDGGEIIVFSGDMADFREGAAIEAKGGSESGDAGFVEISGKEFIFAGDLDLSAENGSAGSLLIDPVDLTIANGSGAATTNTVFEETVENLSVAGVDVRYEAEKTITLENLADNWLQGGSGDITFLTTTVTNSSIDFIDHGDTIATTTGDITMVTGSGGIDIGSLYSGAKAQPVSPGRIRLLTLGGGDIEVEHLSVMGGSDAIIGVVSSGDIEVGGIYAAAGDYLDPAPSISNVQICLDAAGELSTYGGVYARAYALNIANSGIHLDAADGAINLGGYVDAYASASNPAGIANAGVEVHPSGPVNNYSGSVRPIYAAAKVGSTIIAESSTGAKGDSPSSSSGGASVSIEVEDYTGDCVDCPTPRTITDSITVTDIETVTTTKTGTTTRTVTDTETFTRTETATATETVTDSRTITLTETGTATQTGTGTETFTRTDTATGTETVTDSRTITATETGTQTQTATGTETFTRTETATATKSVTDSKTITITETGTATQTGTGTETFTRTETATATQSVTDSRTITITETGTTTKTATGTETFTRTETATATETVTDSRTITITETGTATQTGTGTETFTRTETATATESVTDSRTITATETATATKTATDTESYITTETKIIIGTETGTSTATQTFTMIDTTTITGTFTNTMTDTDMALVVKDGSGTASPGIVYEHDIENASTAGADVTYVAWNSITVEPLITDGVITGGSGDIILYTISIDGFISFDDTTNTITTTSGDIILIGGSGGVTAGNLEIGKNNQGPPTGILALVAVNGGDITAGNLYVRGGKDAYFAALAGGNLSILGDIDVGNTTTDTGDIGLAEACMQAGGNIFIDGSVTVASHGKLSTEAIIHIHADGTVTIDAGSGGEIFAKAETSGPDPGIILTNGPLSANATLIIHSGSTEDDAITISGKKDVLHVRANIKGAVNAEEKKEKDFRGTYTETDTSIDGDVYAKIEVVEGYEGDCPECISVQTETLTTSHTRTITITETATATRTTTETETFTRTETATATETVTDSRTKTITETGTQTQTGTDTETFTRTETATATETVTDSKTITKTETGTTTQTGTDTETFTKTGTATATETVTDSRTKTITETGTATQTGTDTESFTKTATATATKTMTDSRTITKTGTGTTTQTTTDTESFTKTGTTTVTETVTDSRTKTITETGTATQTGTGTETFTRTETATATETVTDTRTSISTETVTVMRTATETQTYTRTEMTVDILPEEESTPAAALPLLVEPEVEGCPVLLDAAALELGITTETIQVSIARSMATSPNIQPCEACENLINFASELMDPDGSKMAAMAQIFNQIAPSDMPPTEDMFASIALAFEENKDNPQFAMASEYADAFVQYIIAMEELGAPVGDSVAFAMEKHGGEIDNPNVAMYIQAQLEAAGI